MIGHRPILAGIAQSRGQAVNGIETEEEHCNVMNQLKDDDIVSWIEIPAILRMAGISNFYILQD